MTEYQATKIREWRSTPAAAEEINVGVAQHPLFCKRMRAVNARAVRIWVLSIGLVVSVVAGNSALKHGVDSAQNQAILALVLNPWVIAGIVLLMAWMLLRMALLSIMPMSIILPLTAGISYVLTGLTGRFLLGETVGARQLWGLVLICIGVLFMGKSSAQDPDTHK